MKDFTYCSHTDCSCEDCVRHQANVPRHLTYSDISIADLNDGYCFLPKQKSPTRREKLLAAICKGTQKTNYKCDETCKAMCGNDGTCAYCSIIADAVEEVV